MSEGNIYAAECFERKTDEQSRLELIKASEVEMPSKATVLASETAYRRGFFQGVYAAFEAMQAGASEVDIGQWLYPVLYDWRYSQHGGKLEEPPKRANVELTGVPPTDATKGG